MQHGAALGHRPVAHPLVILLHWMRCCPKIRTEHCCSPCRERAQRPSIGSRTVDMPRLRLRPKSRVGACRCHAPRVLSVRPCCASAQLYIKCHIPSRDAPTAVKSRRGRRSAGECADPPLWLRGSLLLAAVLVCASFQIPWPTGCSQRPLGASGSAVRSRLPGQAAFAVVACRHAPLFAW